MPAPGEVIKLVERLDLHLDAYRNGIYKEAQLRQEFLGPFFRALGWDMDNTQGFAEAYKEVIHEDTVKIGDNTKATDYLSASAARASTSSRPRNRRSTSRASRTRRFNCAAMPGRPSCRSRS